MIKLYQLSLRILFKCVLITLSTFIIAYVLCLFAFGIMVYSQFNSGTELIVVYGSGNLKSDNTFEQVNTFSGAYMENGLSTQYGPIKVGLSMAFYEITGFKSTDNEGEYAPVLKIDRFYSIYLIFLVLICSCAVLFYSVKSLKKALKLRQNF